MSILLDWLRPQASSGPDGNVLSRPGAWFPSWAWSRRTQAGERVSPEKALTLSGYFAGIRVVAEDVAKLPFVLYRELQPRGKQKATEHPVYRLLKLRPNPDMTAMAFRETLTQWALGWGRGIAEIVRDGRGIPRQLWPIHPSRVYPKKLDGQLVYVVSTDDFGKSEPVVLPAADVLHIHGIGNGVDGYSLAQMAAESIGEGLAAQLQASSFYGNGARLMGMIEHPAEMGQEAYDRLRDSFQDAHAGARNAWKTIILEEDAKFKPVSVSPRDAQLIQARQFTVQDMARWIRVAPHKVGDLSHATFTNIEHQGLEHVTDTLMPWFVRWEQETEYKLFPGEPDLFVKHNANALLRGDNQSRGEFYRAMIFSGVMSPNDVRELEDLNPISDPAADQYYLQTSMAPIGAIAAGQVPGQARPERQEPGQ